MQKRFLSFDRGRACFLIKNFEGATAAANASACLLDNARERARHFVIEFRLAERTALESVYIARERVDERIRFQAKFCF